VIERMMAEYREPAALAEAIRNMRDRGYRDIDAYTPFPVPQVEEALALPTSRLPVAIFVVGITAAAAAYGLQWLVDGYLYPLDVGGRPPHFPPAFVPITFEMGILAAAFTAFFGVLALAKLVRLWHPVFEADGFESVTEGGFWLEVRSRDRHYEAERTARELFDTRAERVMRIGGAR